MTATSVEAMPIYRALYSVVSNRLRAAAPQAVLPATEDAFLYTVTLPPDTVDVAVINAFQDARTFIQCAYWGLLGRLPTEPEAARWLDTSLSSEALHKTLLRALLGSTEFSGRQITVCNVPSCAKVPLRSHLLRAARSLYNSLPSTWRDGIHSLYHACKELLKRQ